MRIGGGPTTVWMWTGERLEAVYRFVAFLLFVKARTGPSDMTRHQALLRNSHKACAPALG